MRTIGERRDETGYVHIVEMTDEEAITFRRLEEVVEGRSVGYFMARDLDRRIDGVDMAPVSWRYGRSSQLSCW